MADFKEMKGSLTIDSENIFPIIKKWLYQDHDIFYRELISNGCDAVTKLKKLSLIGEYEAPADEKYRIDVTVDPDKKTVTVTDNGLGMTEEEVQNYINQVAFSGAADFLKQYKDKANEDQIIGHFGLGFYSAFMVADKVTIDTLSYKKDAVPVHWESEGGTEFSMTEGNKQERGTTITLYLNEDSLEFCNEYRAREVIEKYCSFMPVEIYLHDVKREAKEAKEREEKAKKKAEEAAKKAEEEAKKAEAGETKAEGSEASETAEAKDEASDAGADEEEPEDRSISDTPVNDTDPLWNESPSKVTEEQYKEFYRKVFRDYREPLFWIHLNMDYPFNLKGILYFPKLDLKYDSLEGVIKLYNNQVFIADNIKEVIPEYLMLLKGVIDCPDLPLNVSRSALQNDGFVKKISDYITKKVSDKLSGMFKTDRENYEKYWDDIGIFIKYGCLKDEKFGDKMKDAILFKDIDGKHLTVDEYTEINDKARAGEAEAESKAETKAENAPEGEEKAADAAAAEAAEETGAKSEEASAAKPEAEADTEAKAEEAKASEDKADEKSEKKERIVYYVTDEKAQGQYIRMFRDQKLDAVLLPEVIDTAFIGFMEQKNEGLKFTSIDADLTEEFKDKDEAPSGDVADKLIKLFRTVLKDESLDVKVEKLKDDTVASMMTMSEEGRRMQEMQRMYAMYGMDMGELTKKDQSLVLNTGNKLVQRLSSGEFDKDEELKSDVVRQLYDMALLQRNGLSTSEMTDFVRRSQELMMKL